MCVSRHAWFAGVSLPRRSHLLFLFIAVEVTLTQDARSASAAVMTARQPVSGGIKG